MKPGKPTAVARREGATCATVILQLPQGRKGKRWRIAPLTRAARYADTWAAAPLLETPAGNGGGDAA